MHWALTTGLPYALGIGGYFWHKHALKAELKKNRKTQNAILNAYMNMNKRAQ